MKTCPKCGHQNRDEAKFCGVCATHLDSQPPEEAQSTPSSALICPSCQFSNQPDAKYCENCGADLVQALASTPSSSPAPATPPLQPELVPSVPSQVPDVAPAPTETITTPEPASASHVALVTGVQCMKCGTHIRFCPCCGEPLELSAGNI